MPSTSVKVKKKPFTLESAKGIAKSLATSPYRLAAKDNPHEQTDDFRRLFEENRHDTSIRRGRWAALKEEWIERNLSGRMVHWPTLAPKYGIRAQTGMQKCANEKWYDEIEDRRKAREDVLDQRLTERHIAVIDRMEQDFNTSEEAIRKRHLVFARSLQDKAMEGLRTRPLKDFKARDLIHLLELGIVEERRAMGMKESAELPASPDAEQEVHESYRSIFEQIGGHLKVQQIGTVLLQELQRTGGVIDVVPKGRTDQVTEQVGVQSVAKDGEPEYQPVPEARPKPRFTVKIGPKPQPAQPAQVAP